MQALQVIDGSVLEGGGQILRNSISLSALLGKPIDIRKVRNGRKPPGLKNQHRTGIELAAEIASATLTGATNGSSTVSFAPKQITPGNYTADPVTAGAATLLLQISLPILLFAPSTTASTLTLKGGTNATNAPQIDYIQHIFLPFARRHFGLNVDVDVRRRGYFPKGGGEVHVTVFPGVEGAKLTAASVLERGAITRIGGIAHVAGLPAHLAKTMADSAIARLAASGFTPDAAVPVPVEIASTREKNENTVGGGSGVVLWAELAGGGMIGGSAVGSKQKDAVGVGEEAANELIKGLEAGGCVDEWLEDQIIIFMALAEGTCEVRCGKHGLTLHTQTAIWVAEQLTDAKFDITVQDSGHTIIRCRGIGYTP
ncbi:RNA 3'-terminal phosphate cyclase domain-containing protein [Mycena albidolilacea]|uniref:RNA 3'-terminal-phosphate cyclase (ATP) n=1 Tax=Mycena albidolilacea TaxID=1033008 RepID=A0AAD7A4I9_9AGAR|nr:RNA 3'-terminal phosphate cyclase domain-containing protein [Mycena albidolilacea]